MEVQMAINVNGEFNPFAVNNYQKSTIGVNVKLPDNATVHGNVIEYAGRDIDFMRGCLNLGSHTSKDIMMLYNHDYLEVCVMNVGKNIQTSSDAIYRDDPLSKGDMIVRRSYFNTTKSFPFTISKPMGIDYRSIVFNIQLQNSLIMKTIGVMILRICIVNMDRD